MCHCVPHWDTSAAVLRNVTVAFVSVSFAVSVFLAKREDLNSVQKIAQIIIAWLIPIIGAVALWQFNKSQEQPAKKYSEFGGGNRDSSGAGSDGSY